MSTSEMTKVKQLLKKRFGGVLKAGKHAEDGKCCVRELRACYLGIGWSDHPDGPNASPTDKACQILNDAAWSSDMARTEACLPLVLLTEERAQVGWLARYVEQTIRKIVPIALRAAASVNPTHAASLESAAMRCEQDGDCTAADAAARAADAAALGAADARAAAYAAAYAAALGAASAAARAAARAAYAVKAAKNDRSGDEVLSASVRILIECHTGAG